MAEHVQAALDDMVAPLRDLLERGIFSEPEIKAIVARRREAEYLLRRRAARKADFLRYLEAEMALEKLRSLRMKKLSNRKDRKVASDEKIRKKNGGLPIGDIHIVQLIHLLFVRSLRKFRADISLHLQHAKFAKESKSYNKLTTIYTEALQVHPRNVGLWIEAASHEFFGFTDLDTGKSEGGGSIQGARVLMQRGLRINASAQDLWIQYFCLEMHYLQKLRGRHEILQLSKKSTDAGKAANKAFADAPIPMIVYKNAVKAVPDSVAFRMKFLDACRLFPETEVLEKEITESMETDFSNEPDAWIARAAYVAGKEGEEEAQIVGFAVDADGDEVAQPNKKQRTEALQHPVLKILKESIETLPTSEMYTKAIQFARDYSEEHAESKESTNSFIEHLFEKASDEDKMVTSELTLEHSDYLACEGGIEAAIQCLKDFTMSQAVDVPVVLQLAHLLKISNEMKEAISELERCLKLTPVHDASYMKVLLELFGAMISNEVEYNSLTAVFEQILLLAPNKNPTFEPRFGIGCVAQACLQFLEESREQGEARSAVDKIVEGSTYCESAEGKSEVEMQAMASFFDDALSALAPTNQKEKAKQKLFLRMVHDKAIRFFRDCAPELSDRFRSKRDEFMYS